MMLLYDTALRALVPFTPGESVSMYVCGITPYDATHLGHAATYVTYDILSRRLVDRGHSVRMVRNITDVDDDMLRTARARNVHFLDLGTAQTRVFHADMEAIGNLPPWREPRATSAIADIRGFIGAVLDRGHAYATNGGVFFDVSSAPSFGSLSRLDADAMRWLGPQRGEVPDNPNKRNPLDFVLWKPSQPDEPQWESLWGPGRPGWHVECSALALRELGETIDIHGGGTDLIYPHHECELAQSEAATGAPFVRHWLHQSMVYYRGQKMAKSTGNLVFVADLRSAHEPMAIRLMLLGRHYRTAWTYRFELVVEAERRLDLWRSAGEGDAGLDEVRQALDADLDTPAALAALDAHAGRGAGVSEAATLLGLSLFASA